MNWDIEGRDLDTTEWISLSSQTEKSEKLYKGGVINDKEMKKKGEGEGREEVNRLPSLLSQNASATYILNAKGAVLYSSVLLHSFESCALKLWSHPHMRSHLVCICYHIASCFILFHLVLSNLILSYLMLSFPKVYCLIFALSCLAMSRHIFSYLLAILFPVLSSSIISYYIVSFSIFYFLVWSYCI